MMGVTPMRIVAVILSFLVVFFITHSTGRKGDLQQDGQNSYSLELEQLEEEEKTISTNASPKSESSGTKTKKSQKNHPNSSNNKDVALLPIDQYDWDRIDNQECISLAEEDAVPEWQHRLPYVVIGGAMKAGTEALWSYLKQHPQIIAAPNNKNKEQHFFDKKFENFATADGIMRDAAQQKYGQLYQNQLMSHSKAAFEANSNLIAIDNTPRYLFWSDRIPKRMFCVAPWVKMIVLLRNPVERAYSHYVYTLTENFATKPAAMLQESFEDWIEHDMNQLSDSGVLDDPTDILAWKRYLRTMPDQTYAILGKGLYVIQLRHWFAAMRESNKPLDDMLIMESQQFKTNTQEGYSKVLDFLGLPQHPLVDPNSKHSGHYTSPMKNETQKLLKDFFRPFNKELYQLLDWGPVWG